MLKEMNQDLTGNLRIRSWFKFYDTALKQWQLAKYPCKWAPHLQKSQRESSNVSCFVTWVESEAWELEHFPEHLLNSVRPLVTAPHGPSLWLTNLFCNSQNMTNPRWWFYSFLFLFCFLFFSFFIRVWHSQ